MQEKNIKKEYDVAVIGGGPAGMMAAGKAASLGLKVILLEKNYELGKKLLLTGNGRCNLTNAEFNLKKLVKNYNNGEFLFHAFFVFGPKQIIEFFEKLGVKTKIEAGKRVFPVSDDAEEILKALKKYLAENKVEIIFNSEVKNVVKKNGKIEKIVLRDKEITAKKYILCTGGKSYPKTGSDGLGYELAKKLGHTIIEPRPAISPIRLKDDFVKDLQGISLKNVRINIFQNNKKQFSEDGEIMFTHFGISGPAVLNISSKVGELLESGETKMSLDLSPELNQEEVLKSFEEILKKYPKQIIKNILAEIAPERFAEVLVNVVKIDKNKIANNLSKTEKGTIIKALKSFELTADEILGFEEAMLTRGGISLKEIDHKTMQSKKIGNLFFAGEIIDVNGKTGGFNLQMCWSTGFTAGENCK